MNWGETLSVGEIKQKRKEEFEKIGIWFYLIDKENVRLQTFDDHFSRIWQGSWSTGYVRAAVDQLGATNYFLFDNP